jgi:hypothetical protein
VLGAQRGNDALALAKRLVADGDATVRAQAAWSMGAIGDVSLLPTLVALARGGDADVATNATGAIARIAQTAGKAPATQVSAAVCPVLADGRATVRANALAALAGSGARCADGRAERKLLADDASDLVRANAARVLSGAPLQGQDDRVALDRCAAADRSAEVARHCRPRGPERPGPRGPQAVTVFIVGETGSAARPKAPFLIEYEGGALRAGVADRRGATFDPAAPAGEIVLRRPPAK